MRAPIKVNEWVHVTLTTEDLSFDPAASLHLTPESRFKDKTEVRSWRFKTHLIVGGVREASAVQVLSLSLGQVLSSV